MYLPFASVIAVVSPKTTEAPDTPTPLVKSMTWPDTPVLEGPDGVCCRWQPIATTINPESASLRIEVNRKHEVSMSQGQPFTKTPTASSFGPRMDGPYARVEPFKPFVAGLATDVVSAAQLRHRI